MTAGPLTKAWGFYRREGIYPSSEELAKALSIGGSQYVELEQESRSSVSEAWSREDQSRRHRQRLRS